MRYKNIQRQFCRSGTRGTLVSLSLSGISSSPFPGCAISMQTAVLLADQFFFVRLLSGSVGLRSPPPFLALQCVGVWQWYCNLEESFCSFFLCFIFCRPPLKWVIGAVDRAGALIAARVLVVCFLFVTVMGPNLLAWFGSRLARYRLICGYVRSEVVWTFSWGTCSKCSILSTNTTSEVFILCVLHIKSISWRV